MRKISFIAVPLSLLFYLTIVSAKDNLIPVIVSGETHAMLDACDCPNDAAGGFPKRSTVINSIRGQRDLLLLDAGGFAAGGIYDFYIQGKQRDSVRSLLAIRAMGYLRYDAAALGDEELQYGADWVCAAAYESGLPLVSANCFKRNGKFLTDPYIIVKKSGTTFGITAVTTQEKLFPIDTSVIIKNPVTSIKSIWKELTRKSDVQVILSHTGEEKTIEIGRYFPDCEILVNGHRKTSIMPARSSDDQTIIQFGFQGKSLARVDFKKQKKQLAPENASWIEINRFLSDDEDAAGILLELFYDTLPKRTAVDLYLMSKCPFGLPALKDLLRLQEQFSAMDLNIWFIGDVKPDSSLKSLGGEEEIKDEMLWLAIQNIYPELWGNFLYLSASEGISVKQAIKDLEIDSIRIARWVKERAKEHLSNHYTRSNRLHVNASPSLFINNHLFGSEIAYLRLAKDFCHYVDVPKKPAVCDSLPECFIDSECRQSGKIGMCKQHKESSGGSCSFKDAVSFDFMVLLPDGPLQHPENKVIATTEQLFPGASIKTYSISSVEGKKIAKDIKPAFLPLYLFEKSVAAAHNYERVAPGLFQKGEWFTFKDGVMEKYYHLKRKEEKGAAVLFIDPLFKDVDQILAAAVRIFPDFEHVTVRPLIYEDAPVDTIQPQEKERHKEALRWLILEKHYGKKKFTSYLQSYCKYNCTSQWNSVLKAIQINTDDFVKKTEKHTALISKLYSEINEFSIDTPVMVLVENRELVPISNPVHLEKVLTEIKKRFARR